MHLRTLMLGATLTMRAGTVGVLPMPMRAQSDPLPVASRSAAAGISDLLAAARGVAPALCALAADGASQGWGGSWDAPDLAITGNAHQLLRGLRGASLAAPDVQLLLDALGSDDACVRHLGGTLIGRLGDRTLVPRIAARLSAASAPERAGVARALGLLGDRSAVSAIVRVLGDATPSVRANAAWALGHIGERSSAGSVAPLARDAVPEVRAAAVTTLGRLEAADNVDVLIGVLKNDTSPEVRRVAAWALGQIHARAAADGLDAALRGDRSAPVREMSAWALAEAHAREHVQTIASVMRSDNDADVRETAAWALGEMDEKSSADALAQTLANDKSTPVRATAAWAIGQLEPSRAPRALVVALHDTDDDVRLKAAWALSQISDNDVIPDVTAALRTEQRDRVRQALVRALIESGERSADVFKDLLESKDQATREMAVRALAGRRGPWPWPWPWPRPRPFP